MIMLTSSWPNSPLSEESTSLSRRSRAKTYPSSTATTSCKQSALASQLQMPHHFCQVKQRRTYWSRKLQANRCLMQAKQLYKLLMKVMDHWTKRMLHRALYSTSLHRRLTYCSHLPPHKLLRTAKCAESSDLRACKKKVSRKK